MTNKHTPGPWRSDFLEQGNGPLSGSFLVHDHDPMNPLAVAYSEENARLIAAAPELLKALKDCEARLDLLVESGRYKMLDAVAAENARAAIAKATGGAA